MRLTTVNIAVESKIRIIYIKMRKNLSKIIIVVVLELKEQKINIVANGKHMVVDM